MTRFQRQRTEGQDAHAATLELFYDLVFVFAITQVSHTLLEHLTWEGAGQAALVLLVVWWSWNYTTWVTNELDPESPAVRGLMVAIMLATMLMAVAIPDAFGERAGLFVGAYVAIQVGRHLFLTFVSAGPRSLERTRAGHILVWFAVAGAGWVAGAVAEGELRTVLWLAALLVDYLGPLLTYRLPGVPSLPQGSWDVDPTHFAERFSLFVIIALGESIVITGATASEAELGTSVYVGVGVAFLGTAALWWLYFGAAARIAEHELATVANRVGLARDAFTYLHALLVAGVILTAVGDELVIAHPSEPLERAELAAVVSGPLVYLLAHALFRLRLTGRADPGLPVGAVGCALAGVLLQDADALVVAGVLLAVVVAVIAAGELGARRGGGLAVPAQA